MKCYYKILLAAAVCFPGLYSAAQDTEYGDAPEGTIAYPTLGVMGKFPTCKTVTLSGYVEHHNFGAYLGPGIDFEIDGNAGLCPGFAPYDADECIADMDAGLTSPLPYTIIAGVESPCPGAGTSPLDLTCQNIQWGNQVDISIANFMPNDVDAFMNVVIDWDQDGQWGGSSLCPGNIPVPEHVLVNWLVPNGYVGLLSGLSPPSFASGPNHGFVWGRFTISERGVSQDWDGSGSFEDGESEDYLLEILPLIPGINNITMGDIDLSLSPNPAGDYVRVSYYLDSPGSVVVKVYDVTGRHAGNIDEQVKGRGRHVCLLDLTGTAPNAGMYLIEVQVDGVSKGRARLMVH